MLLGGNVVYSKTPQKLKCRTELNENTIRALTRYHVESDKKIKRSKNITCFIGIMAFIISCINAYGIWMKYYGTESIFIVIVRSFLFVFFSLLILFAGVKGREHNLNRELKKYFEQTNTEYLDYIISEDGILLNVNEKGTMFKWDVIDYIKSDDNYYYFSSQGKHSIIAKEPLSLKNKDMLETLIESMNKC